MNSEDLEKNEKMDFSPLKYFWHKFQKCIYFPLKLEKNVEDNMMIL